MEISKIEISKLKTEKITFECEVVTPMFIGGANKEDAELRGSSIKGLLRFWWRVINGYKFDTIKKMYEKEKEIFGSTDSSSSFQIVILDISSLPIKINLPQGDTFTVKNFNLHIIDYLAYGSLKQGNNYIKSYYPVGTKFKIIFDFYNKNYKNDVLLAFKILGSYGGIGSKSRNGFGCFKIIDGKQNLNNLSLGKDTYNNVNPKEFLIFSKDTKKFDINITFNSWVDALSAVGIIYRNSRLDLEKRHNFDQRAKIGMPIIAKNEPKSFEFKNKRLAKPIFLHVEKAGNNNYKAWILLIPYRLNNQFWEDFKKIIKKNIENY